MKSTIAALASSLILATAPLSEAVAQQSITSDEIVQNLKPRPRTRGLGAPVLVEADKAFLSGLKQRTRGLTIEEREQVSSITARANLPAIDLEVNFSLNSASLEASAIETLRKLGAALQSQELSGASFLVSGYTDARGVKTYNQKLSEQRAEAVRSYLSQSFRINADNLIVVGYGQDHLKNPTNPLADENRRVQIVNIGK